MPRESKVYFVDMEFFLIADNRGRKIFSPPALEGHRDHIFICHSLAPTSFLLHQTKKGRRCPLKINPKILPPSLSCPAPLGLASRVE
jgi:hypothetical protein